MEAQLIDKVKAAVTGKDPGRVDDWYFEAPEDHNTQIQDSKHKNSNLLTSRTDSLTPEVYKKLNYKIDNLSKELFTEDFVVQLASVLAKQLNSQKKELFVYVDSQVETVFQQMLESHSCVTTVFAQPQDSTNSKHNTPLDDKFSKQVKHISSQTEQLTVVERSGGQWSFSSVSYFILTNMLIYLITDNFPFCW